MNKNLFQVGNYIPKFNQLTGQNLPCGPIYQSPGLSIHVAKHHPDDVALLANIPDIIKQPDYIGKHPKEANSIELVKSDNDNMMVCIKLDQKDNYLFVASFYRISKSKLANRLNSGRLNSY